MKFKVRISELRYGEMDVIAASEEEAREIAEKNPGDVTWVDSETTDMTVEDQPTKPVAPVPEDRSCQRISPNIIQMSGSLLESKAEVVAHVVNSSGVMKGRVANAIRQTYPEIFPIYQKICENNPWVSCHLALTRDRRLVANLFGQGGRESDWKINYRALESALETLVFAMTRRGLTTVAMPFGMGCGLAGGDWETVLGIMKKVFAGTRIHVELWKLESKENTDVCKDNEGASRFRTEPRPVARSVEDMEPGYHDEPITEAFVWEPKDWTAEEWAILCKICGLPADRTDRIVLHASESEFYITHDRQIDPPKTKNPCPVYNSQENDRTYIVTEFCPHCESEIEMRWNTDKRGFKAFCPVCSKRLMLCDECHQTGDYCDYDSKTDSCHCNPNTENKA